MPDTRLGCITAGQHDRPRWGTYRLVGDCMGKEGATICHGVEVGRIGRAIQAVGANEIPAELVGKIKNDIRLLLWRCAWYRALCFGCERCSRGRRSQHELASIGGQCKLPSPSYGCLLVDERTPALRQKCRAYGARNHDDLIPSPGALGRR